ncbi:unnamed protein product, partial [Adineta steineri]
MNLAEQENHNQQHLLLSSSTTNDDSTVKTRRSSSVLIAIEPVMLLTEEVDDGESVATSKPFALSGILYSLLGCFLFCTASFTIKELQIDLLDALVIRFIIQIFLFGIFVVSHHYPIWIGSSKEKWLQLVLCILNGFVFLGYFIGFRYLALPDLTTINFTRLLWTVVFATLISLLQTLGVICGNRAVKRERPSIVTIVSASEIIYAILL